MFVDTQECAKYQGGGINEKKKQICLLNNKGLSNHRCERINMAAKGQIFLNVTYFISISKKTPNMSIYCTKIL